MTKSNRSLGVVQIRRLADESSELRDIAVQPTMLSANLHRVTVTQTELNDGGLVTIDRTLLEAARLLPGERVNIVDVTNGDRLTTGDIAIVIACTGMDEVTARRFTPRVVFVDRDNRVVEVGGDPAVVPDGVRPEASWTPRGQS